MNLTFSRRLALLYGVLLPIVETIRRWQQLGDFRMWPAWLDDVLLGAALLYGAWRVAKNVESGRPSLMARFIACMNFVMAPFTPSKCRSESWPLDKKF